MRRFSLIGLVFSQVLLLGTLAGCSTQPPVLPEEPLPTVMIPTPIPTQQPTPTAIPVPTPTPVVSPAPGGSGGGTLTLVSAADIPHRDVHQVRQETLAAPTDEPEKHGEARLCVFRASVFQKTCHKNKLLRC